MNPIVDLIVILAIVAMVLVNLYSLRDSVTTASLWTRLSEKVGACNLPGNSSVVSLSFGPAKPSQDGNVEKSHQRRSRHFAVLTYWKYAPRVKKAVALLDDCFDHSRSS